MVGDFLKRVAADRVAGERPGPLRAFGAATAVGGGVAVLVYRLLRRESS